tara:strand:- start:90 stop:437 length:348 start_codon:yes stop_codon:yes gene_type:complete
MALDYTLNENQKKAPQRYTKQVSENRHVQVSFAGVAAAVLTGTPTVAVTGMTSAAEAINSSAATINGLTVAASKSITFDLSGGTANTDYTIVVSTATADETAMQYDLEVRVVADS